MNSRSVLHQYADFKEVDGGGAIHAHLRGSPFSEQTSFFAELPLRAIPNITIAGMRSLLT